MLSKSGKSSRSSGGVNHTPSHLAECLLEAQGFAQLDFWSAYEVPGISRDYKAQKASLCVQRCRKWGHRDINLAFTECDQCWPGVQSALPAEGRAAGPSEDKMLEWGLVVGEGILQLEDIGENAEVWKSLGITERWGFPCPGPKGEAASLNKRLPNMKSDRQIQ